jgi:hypothetical protein
MMPVVVVAARDTYRADKTPDRSGSWIGAQQATGYRGQGTTRGALKTEPMGLEVHSIDSRATTDQPAPPPPHTRWGGKKQTTPPPPVHLLYLRPTYLPALCPPGLKQPGQQPGGGEGHWDKRLGRLCPKKAG